MEQEFLALRKNETWELVPPPSRVNVIDSKWIFKVKRHVDGSVERYKARLVAKGLSNNMVLITKTLSVLSSSLPPFDFFSHWQLLKDGLSDSSMFRIHSFMVS